MRTVRPLIALFAASLLSATPPAREGVTAQTAAGNPRGDEARLKRDVGLEVDGLGEMSYLEQLGITYPTVRAAKAP